MRAYAQHRYTAQDGLENELRALAELVGRHADEFADILAGLGEVVRLADARKPQRRRSGW